MDWKAVEMQVALPRTIDSSKLQQELLSRGIHHQDLLMETTEKLRKRKKVDENDEAEFANFKQNEDHNQLPPEPQRQTQRLREQAIRHPYKGNRLDFKG